MSASLLPVALCLASALTVAITNVMVKRGGDVLTTRAIVAIVMGLTGAARTVTRAIPMDRLAQGGPGPSGVHLDPCTYLVERLQSQFADHEEETRLAAMTEHMAFHRRPNETISAMLTRLEVSRARAAQEGGLVMNVEATALQILRACGVRASDANHVLRDTQGELPQTEQQLNTLRMRLRTWGANA